MVGISIVRIANLLGRDTITAGYVDNFLHARRWYIHLHPVAHIEHLVHFLPVSTGCLLDGGKQGRCWQQVVFDKMNISTKFQTLGLGPAGAMDQALNLTLQFSQGFVDHRGVTAGWAEYRRADGHAAAGQGILQPVRAAIGQVPGQVRVKSFRVLVSIIVRQHVMPGAGEAVAAHAAVGTGFIAGLASG